jgi:hypothetical protein
LGYLSTVRRNKHRTSTFIFIPENPKDEANGVKVFFNAHMEEIIDIHIKEN